MGNRNILDELVEDVELTINSCGYSNHAIGWAEKKKHPDYDLWLVTRGEVTFDYRGGKAAAREGDIVFFNPDVPYSANCYLEPCRHIYIHFDFPLGQRFNFLNEFDLMGVIPGELFKKEGVLFCNTFDSYMRKEPLAPLMLKGYFLVLLARLLAIPQERNSQSEYISSVQETKHFVKLKPVLQYIEEHIGDHISAEQLADMIGMSPKYFYSYFKTNIGLTPQNYITRIKMNRAREYLIDRSLTVKEIAYQLGFSDPYTFSKVFKRFNRTSPSRFYDHT